MENHVTDVFSTVPTDSLQSYQPSDVPVSDIAVPQKPLVYNYEDTDEQWSNNVSNETMAAPTAVYVPPAAVSENQGCEDSTAVAHNGHLVVDELNSAESVVVAGSALLNIPFPNPCPTVSDPASNTYLNSSQDSQEFSVSSEPSAYDNDTESCETADENVEEEVVLGDGEDTGKVSHEEQVVPMPEKITLDSHVLESVTVLEVVEEGAPGSPETDDLESQLARLHENGFDEEKSEEIQPVSQGVAENPTGEKQQPGNSGTQLTTILDDWGTSTDPTDEEESSERETEQSFQENESQVDAVDAGNNVQENEETTIVLKTEIEVDSEEVTEANLTENTSEMTQEVVFSDSPVPDHASRVVVDVIHTFSSAKKANDVLTDPEVVDEVLMKAVKKVRGRGHFSGQELREAIEILGKDIKTIPTTPGAKITEVLTAEEFSTWEGLARTQKKSASQALVLEESTLDQKRVEAYARRGGGRGRGPRGGAVKIYPRQRVNMDRDSERQLALKQLATFDSLKKRPSSSRRNGPMVAANDLGRALASTPVLTGKRKEPCYKPKPKENVETSTTKRNPNAVFKTYMAKAKNKVPNDVKTGLQTIAIVNKVISDCESTNSDHDELQAAKKNKRTRELENLLGDEGAVRMIYDAAQKDSPDDVQPKFKKTKRGLEEQSKYVENVMRSSSAVSEKSLRGKRVKQNEAEVSPPSNEEALFPPATPGENATPEGRSRKKKKPAEASRILYRHSSSESFDGSEGLRRTPSEIAGLDMIGSSSSQRKSSRARKVSSKMSDFISASPRKGRKDELKPPNSKNEPNLLREEEDSKEFLAVNSVEDANTKSAPKAPSTSKVYRASKKKSNVRVKRSAGISELVLTKAAFDTEVLKQLTVELENANKDDSCKVIVLTSEGTVFCQGIDLMLLEPGSDVSSLVSALRALVTTLARVEKPVVAGVQGSAVGLAVSLLPLCDVVIASNMATFSTPYTRLGQGLEGAASYTFPLIGQRLVTELIYKGSKLTAEDAYEFGLVSEVFPMKSFPEKLAELAKQVAANTAKGLMVAKKQMTQDRMEKIERALDVECAALEESWSSAEWLSATADFLASGYP